MNSGIKMTAPIGTMSRQDLESYAFSRNFDPLLVRAVVNVLTKNATVGSLDAVFFDPSEEMLLSIVKNLPEGFDKKKYWQLQWGCADLQQQIDRF